MADTTLVLDDNDLRVLSAALGELPLKIALPLVRKIEGQIAESKKASENVATDGDKD